jgi:hypothetical protein
MGGRASKRVIALVVVVLLSGCSALVGLDAFRPCRDDECKGASEAGTDSSDTSAMDAPMDSMADSGACNPLGAFDKPELLPMLNTTTDDEMGGSFSADGTRFYFAQRSFDAGTELRLFSARVVDGGFVEAGVIPELDDIARSFSPTESPSGLHFYFFSYRPPSLNGFGGVFLSTRQKVGDAWGIPGLNAGLSKNGGGGPVDPHVGFLYWSIDNDLFRGTIDDMSGNLFSETNVDVDGGKVNTVSKEFQPIVTPDELHLYFTSDRSGLNEFHIWETHRASTNDPWPTPTLVPPPISTTGPGNESVHFITPDNCTLYYTSPIFGSLDMFRATRKK